MLIREKIRSFILNDLLEEKIFEFDDNTDIVSSGMLDSLSVVRLMVFLEDTYDISIEEVEDLERLKSINTMTELVILKTKNQNEV